MKRSADARPNRYLKRERECRCWSQLEIADAIGTTAFNVSRWERGITLPSAYFRRQLCQLFEKSAQELGFLDDAPSLLDKGSPATPAQEPADVSPDTTMEPQSDATTGGEATVWSAVEEQDIPHEQTLWHVPFRRNSYFTGRESVLEQIHALLKHVQTGDSCSPHIVSLSGLGGIGKTQIAVEYAYRYSSTYQAVLWIQANSRNVLNSSVTMLSSLLELPERDAQDQNCALEAVKRWLSTTTNWLLIMDDVDDPKRVYDILPATGNGAVLLTTLTPITATITRGMELDTMTQDEGAAFLLRRAKLLAANDGLEHVSPEQRRLAEVITQSMGGLPLALDQAAAYIEETGCGLAGYFQRYQQHRELLLKRRGGLLPEHPVALSTTWSLSLEKVARLNPGAIDVLRLLAFLHAEAIPECIISAAASEAPPLAIMRDPLALDDAIGTLRAFSLVRRRPETNSLTIHRLVQEVLQDQMAEHTRIQWAQYAVKVINRMYPGVTFEHWPLCQQYLPQAQACAQLIERWEMVSPEAAELLYKAGCYLRERAQYVEAEPMLQRALEIREHLYGSLHLTVAESLHELGLLSQAQGNYSLAQAQYQRALSLRERLLGHEHAQVADILNNLAVLYHAQAQYDLAESCYSRTLSIRIKTLGAHHPHVADCLDDLAILHYTQGKYMQAEPLYQRSLAIREQFLGTRHPDVAESLNNLAVLYRTQKRYDLAEALYLRALDILEEAKGDHPHLAFCLHNLAKLYQTQGKYVEAEPLYRRSLEIREHILGKIHPDVAQNLANLGVLYLAQEKYSQAEPLLVQALQIREQLLHGMHPHIANSLNHLAKLSYAQKKYAQAETYFQRALVILEHGLGEQHPLVATTLHDVTLLYQEMGNYEQAASSLKRSLAIRQQTLDEDHPDLASLRQLQQTLLEQMAHKPGSEGKHERTLQGTVALVYTH
ncbi:MAG TPA: tetratricopeptide repeat protein [Ktedonosporobacter sp.]|nr:tetratricopeptide repeat protein [Ktedonosporobacter sp.]